MMDISGEWRAEPPTNKCFSIDQDLIKFLVTQGRVPFVTDERKPWSYRGWMALIVQQMHRDIHIMNRVNLLCALTGEPPALEHTTTQRSAKGQADRGAFESANIVPRWEYLARTIRAGRLLDEPIPVVRFSSSVEGRCKEVLKEIGTWVDVLERHGAGWNAFVSLAEWLGWALGVHDQKPRVDEAVNDELYRLVRIQALMACPYDYMGQLACERFGGGPNAFFPTPHEVVEMMVVSTFPREEDCRRLTCCDPALGSGRMLLHSSNYSMRLYGQDIDWLVLLCAKINFALYAPWAICPLPDEYYSDTPPGPRPETIDLYRQDVMLESAIASAKEHHPFYKVFGLLQSVAGQAQIEDAAIEPTPQIEAAPEAAIEIVELVQEPESKPVEQVIQLSAPAELDRVSDSAEIRIDIGGQLSLFGMPAKPKRGKK